MRGWISILNATRAAHRAAILLVFFFPALHAQLGQQASASTAVGRGATAQSSTLSSNSGITSQSSNPTGFQDPYTGSVISEKATNEVIKLSLKVN